MEVKIRYWPDSKNEESEENLTRAQKRLKNKRFKIIGCEKKALAQSFTTRPEFN